MRVIHFLAPSITTYHASLMSSTLRRSFVRVHGLDLHWAEIGEGRPLVLLHGISDSLRTWLDVVPALARSHRVLLLDLAGHGLSARPDASYALAWHAGVVGGWLEALGLSDVDLVGHSFGGGVAQWMLLEHRARIRRLALVAAGGLGSEVGFALRLASIPRVVERFGQPFMGPGTQIALNAAGGAYSKGEIAELAAMNAIPGSARAFARSVRDVIDWRGQHRHFLDRAAEVGELPPVALFWGDRDTVIPLAHGIETASLLEGASLTQFAGCGHFPHRQQPDRFARALAGFLDAPGVPVARIRPLAASRSRARRRPLFQRAWSAVREGVRAALRTLAPRSRKGPARARLALGPAAHPEPASHASAP
jgi:pimeloyl-ACP methyl ester carboxylesterase